MAGLNDTDIKLNDAWQLSQAANGDTASCSGFECVMQDIYLEALSAEGELWYDETWGWSLIDFVQSENDELNILDIKERVKTKLEKRDIIDQETVNTEVSFNDDVVTVYVTFRFINNDDTYSVTVTLDRILVEVR